MNRIIVRSSAVQTKTLPARNGKPEFTLRSQRAAIECGEDFPQPFNLQLGRDRPPYPEGEYLVDASSFGANEYGDLGLKRDVVLTPIPAARPVAAKVG